MDLELGWIDTTVLILSVAIVMWVGFAVGRRTHSYEAFLLGDRGIAWWAILGSIVATETSTATVLSLPANAFGPTGMKMAQLGIGIILGRFIVVWLLMPLFFQGKLFSAYEVFGRRFGRLSTRFASALFLVTRNAGDGLRLFLAALVISRIMGWSLAWSALSIGVATIIYTSLGGMRSIVWNDCIQLLIYLSGGIATLFIITRLLPAGWQTVWEYGEAHQSFEIVNVPENIPDGFWGKLGWILGEPLTLWGAVIGGCVLSLGTHGTDQMMVQRYLSARSQRDASIAVLASGFVVAFQYVLFLFIGVELAAFHASQAQAFSGPPDEVYVDFIVRFFPSNVGLIGLMLAAILAAAMSTLSSSLNASAAALVNDFYLPWNGKKLAPERLLWITRLSTIGFGMLQVGIGIWAATLQRTVITNALTIAGYSSGLLLGLFLLAVLTKRVGQYSALIGAGVGLATLLFCQFGIGALVRLWNSEIDFTVGWTWYALIGALTTFIAGWSCSLVINEPNAKLVEDLDKT